MMARCITKHEYWVFIAQQQRQRSMANPFLVCLYVIHSQMCFSIGYRDSRCISYILSSL